MQCGYSLAQQAALFHSIKPLFANKPVLIVVNKTDVAPLEGLPDKEARLIREMAEEAARISSGSEWGGCLGGVRRGRGGVLEVRAAAAGWCAQGCSVPAARPLPSESL